MSSFRDYEHTGGMHRRIVEPIAAEPVAFEQWAKEHIPEGADVSVVMLCRRAWRAAIAHPPPVASSVDGVMKLARNLATMEVNAALGFRHWAKEAHVALEAAVTQLLAERNVMSVQIRVQAENRAELEAERDKLRGRIAELEASVRAKDADAERYVFVRDCKDIRWLLSVDRRQWAEEIDAAITAQTSVSPTPANSAARPETE